MTAQETIEKIRAEVERLKNDRAFFDDNQQLAYWEGLNKVSEKLSDLEKECTIPNDLEKYASRSGFDYVDNIVQENPGHRWNDHDVEFAHRDGIIAGAEWQREKSEKPTNIDFEQELYKHFGQVKDFTLGMQIGKYFYELGKQSKQPVCEGLEEEYKDYVENDPVYSKLVNGIVGLSIARHFAQWGAEHLKK